MKVTFRILFLILSLGILVYAALPPPDPVGDAPTSTSPDTEPRQEDPTPRKPDSSLIRDFLGGPQLDAGNKAKDILNEVNAQREEDLKELDP